MQDFRLHMKRFGIFGTGVKHVDLVVFESIRILNSFALAESYKERVIALNSIYSWFKCLFYAANMKWMEYLQSDINVECKNGMKRKSKREKMNEREGEGLCESEHLPYYHWRLW